MALRRVFATVLLLSSSAATAATLNWPTLVGGGPCSGTLQACVDAAAAGDTIVIVGDELFTPDRYTAISEPILIRKSLTLTAAPGIDAVFAPGFNISIDPNTPGPHTVTVSGLTMRRGSVAVRDNGTVAGSVFRIERMYIAEPAPTNVFGCAIDFQTTSPSPQFIAGDNFVSTGSASTELRSAICGSTGSASSVITANVFRNRLVAGGSRLRFGITLNAGVAGGNFRISNNTILGPLLVDGIASQRTQGTAPHTLQVDNNVIALQDDNGGWAMRLQAGNTNATVVNNTTVHNHRGIQVDGFDALQVSGRVANNLIAFNTGVGASFAGGALTNSHNLVFGNATNVYTPGPSTITADPMIDRPTYPRPTNGSPAADAGNNVDVPSLALFDADGERRIAFGVVDIGAYEATGDAAARITATNLNSVFNETFVTPFPVALSPADTLVVTPQWATWPAGVSSMNLGVYENPQSPSGWSVFLQQPAMTMPFGAAFNVLAPFRSKTGIVHTTGAGNTSGALTTVDNVELNGALNRSRVMVALPQWDGIYHDVPIGMRWVSTGGGRWQVRNENGAAMPATLQFNVVVAPFLSPNAFRTTLNDFAQTEWRLEHPLLDGNPCAAPIVGRVDDPDGAGDIPNTTGFGVLYVDPSGTGAPGRWVVRADAPSGTPSFPAGSAFHVIIDGAQANGCRAPQVDAVFANGFE
jgi:hypothetical protein